MLHSHPLASILVAPCLTASAEVEIMISKLVNTITLPCRKGGMEKEARWHEAVLT